MNMYLTQIGGDYVTYNLVDVFDRDRAIGWLPGRLDDEGNHVPGGWFWRYDLAANGDGTDVTLTYDWTDTPQEFRDQVGECRRSQRTTSRHRWRHSSEPSKPAEHPGVTSSAGG